ncbi:unnamed protein product [Moneuplotes crassus]|uniref:Uncharacterized protein n=1 Tax=Euplotes crassus TaxID=5936 RepID=A0AAD2CWY4_EUPCR|nr:unnamed protein product [Moneuplotes crassus]
MHWIILVLGILRLHPVWCELRGFCSITRNTIFFYRFLPVFILWSNRQPSSSPCYDCHSPIEPSCFGSIYIILWIFANSKVIRHGSLVRPWFVFLGHEKMFCVFIVIILTTGSSQHCLCYLLSSCGPDLTLICSFRIYLFTSSFFKITFPYALPYFVLIELLTEVISKVFPVYINISFHIMHFIHSKVAIGLLSVDLINLILYFDIPIRPVMPSREFALIYSFNVDLVMWLEVPFSHSCCRSWLSCIWFEFPLTNGFIVFSSCVKLH